MTMLEEYMKQFEYYAAMSHENGLVGDIVALKEQIEGQSAALAEMAGEKIGVFSYKPSLQAVPVSREAFKP